MFAKQKFLGLVDLGGQVGGATPIGMNLHHQVPVGASNVALAGPGVTPSIS